MCLKSVLSNISGLLLMSLKEVSCVSYCFFPRIYLQPHWRSTLHKYSYQEKWPANYEWLLFPKQCKRYSSNYLPKALLIPSSCGISSGMQSIVDCDFTKPSFKRMNLPEIIRMNGSGGDTTSKILEYEILAWQESGEH